MAARATSKNVLRGKNISITGLAELDAKLQALGGLQKEKRAEMQQVLLEGVQAIRNQIVARVPVDTGKLRDSLKAAISPSKDAAAFAAVDRKIAWYGRLVEFGHGGAQPRPFWRPGIAAAKPEVIAIVKQGLAKIIEDIAREAK